MLCVIFAVFGLSAAVVSNDLIVPFECRFFCSSSDNLFCPDQKKSAHIPRKEGAVVIELVHAEQNGSGSVRVFAPTGIVTLMLTYARSCFRSSTVSMSYAFEKIFVQALESDFAYGGVDGTSQARIGFMPPFPSIVGWSPQVCGRPELSWMCACDGERLVFTRFMFNSVREGKACVWSLNMALDNVAAGVVSLGEMTLLNDKFFDVKTSRTFNYSHDLEWVEK